MHGLWSPGEIKALMKRTGKTTLDLAAELRVHQVTVENWVGGRQKPASIARAGLDRIAERAGAEVEGAH